jgi:hypothetical protein
MNKITGTAHGEIDVKRLYLPGIKVKSQCEKCSTLVTMDLADEYMSNPSIGAPEPVYFYCDNCEHTWAVDVILKLSLKLA